jgi:tetratricopeptide (TPR) repeat protein
VATAGTPASRTALKNEWQGIAPLTPPKTTKLIGDADTLFQAAMADYSRGDYAKASINLRRATEANPEAAEPRLYLACSFMMTGDLGAAIHELRAAVQLSEGDTQALAQIILAKALLDRQDTASATRLLEQVASGNSAWSAKARSLVTRHASAP